MIELNVNNLNMITKYSDELVKSKVLMITTFFCGGATMMSVYLTLMFIYSNVNIFPHSSVTSPSFNLLGINQVNYGVVGKISSDDNYSDVNSYKKKRKYFEGAETEALASLHVALEMKKHQKFEKARKLFLHAMALNPLHSDILNHYGEFLEENEKNVILADHLYQRALAFTPDHTRALSNRQRTLPQVEELDDNRFKRIDQKRDLLSQISENSASLKRIKKEAYFQHIYHTVGLEGNTMTLSQTRHVLETRMAISGKSIMEHNEILGLDAALSFVNQSLVHRIGAITVKDILDIHKRVLGFVDPIEAGRFRRTQVWIGEHIPPHPSQVQRLMDDLVKWLNDESNLNIHPIQFAAIAHFKMVNIHPFIDGNGRTARLLMNLILMQGGYPPVIVPKSEKSIYYQYLKDADEGDVRPFVRFIAECTEQTIDVYLYATKEYPVSEIPELPNGEEVRRIIVV